jgi:hypothetical protein
MTKNERLTLIVSNGIFFGSVLLILTLIAMDKADDWETLASGFMALCAAVWAAYLLNKQIQQADKHEQNRNKRLYVAARATLPLALSQVCAYCIASAESLKSIYMYLAGGEFGIVLRTPDVTTHDLPQTVLTNFETILERTPHDMVADRLSDLIAMIQVFQSRCEGINREFSHMDHNFVAECISNCAAIYATSSSLFDYARDKTQFDREFILEPIMFDKVMSAYFAFSMHNEIFEPIKSLTRRDIERNRVVNADTF